MAKRSIHPLSSHSKSHNGARVDRRATTTPAMCFSDLPDWLTPEEARAFLRLGRSAIYEQLNSGELPSRRFGRKIRIAKEVLRPHVPTTTLPAA